MEKLNNVRYELLDYLNYKDRLNEILKDDKLSKYGISYNVIGKTSYGYDIDCITIGRGNKHLFVVGGTHGSEIIGGDFVTQLISEIKNLSNFDPNEFTLYVIPNQNPEGFVITTDSLSGNNIDEIENKSYEYYYRYKLDNLIYRFVNELDSFFHSNENVSEDIKVDKFKRFINNNKHVKKLSSYVNGFDRFLNNINNIGYVDDLKLYLAVCCDNVKSNDKYLCAIMRELKEYFLRGDKFLFKFHQDMFRDSKFSYINNKLLGDSISNIYKLYRHPIGSLVTFDATGIGINLNANNRDNPGIEYMKSGYVKMAPSARNNLKNYTLGPLGVPSINPNNFEYAVENVALYNLIKSSYDKGNYIGILLYHATGGSIYYEPNNVLVDRYGNSNYIDIFNYNLEMASIYGDITGYKLNNWSDTTGYGDHLRAEFPGVLMIELSRMGGNPIGPYGDKNNIYKTINDNFWAIDKLLLYFSKIDINSDKRSRKIIK